MVGGIRDLRVEVKELGTINFGGCLLTRPKGFIVTGGTALMFQYKDAETGKSAISRIESNFFEEQMVMLGNINSGDAPTVHFYTDDLTLVQYYGNSLEVIQVLERTLGPQFTSGDSAVRC